MQRHRVSFSPMILMAAFWAGCVLPSACDAQETAQDILAATGVKGGLVVHIGSPDAASLERSVGLYASEAYRVLRLDREDGAVETARRHIRVAGIYGKVSADRLADDRLPLADNVVALVVAEHEGDVAAAEVRRVLSPGGVAYVRRDGGWRKRVKPRPDDIDEWTHLLYDPGNNAVSRDRVAGPPHRLQWIGGPLHARSHEHLGTVSVVVSSGGRIFSIVDEGQTASVALPAQWFLVAQDAFSGVMLWKRQIDSWENHLHWFRAGPPELGRRLVAMGERLYVTLGYGEPVSELDAATGVVLQAYPQTAGAYEILCDGERLYVAAGDRAVEAGEPAASGEGRMVPPARDRRLLVVDAATGKTVWKKHDADTRQMLPTALAVAGDRVVFQNPEEMVCLDRKTGAPLWRAPRPLEAGRPNASAPTLVLYDDVVLSADLHATPGEEDVLDRDDAGNPVREGSHGQLIVFSAETGERLWRAPAFTGFNAPVDVFVANRMVWTGRIRSVLDPGFTVARDPATGEARLTRPADDWEEVQMPHHRCYRNRATERYLLLGRAGVEFLDTTTGELTWNHWIRGTCQFGIVPANGLVYVPPHACACYVDAMLNGFIALAPKADTERAQAEAVPAKRTRLEKGPAYGRCGEEKEAVEQVGDWPMYRHDGRRSGVASEAVPADCRQSWGVKLNGRLSSPVAAAGRVFVAAVDEHTVHAYDAATGKALWCRTVGGRVDSPPSVYKGAVFFGSADGYVYCLRASDGALAWRFRGAPWDRRIVCRDQLESVWPVHGSVLVTPARPGEAGRATVHFAAGRSSYLDGGIRLYRLDAETGDLLAENCINDRDPQTGRQKDKIVKDGFDIPGLLSDVLSRDDTQLYLRHRVFDPDTLAEQPAAPHLFSPAGFLDGAWWHRTYWIIADRMRSGFRDWTDVGNRVPSGRILAVDRDAVYGYGRLYYDMPTAGHVGFGRIGYHLYAADRATTDVSEPPQVKPGERPVLARLNFRWRRETPMLVRAMALAGPTLFVAGPPDLLQENSREGAAALAGRKGGALRAVSAKDGAVLGELPLTSPPVFDGLIAAGGRLYMTCMDGALRCYEPPAADPEAAP